MPQVPPATPHIPQLSLQTPSTPNPSAVGTAANPQQKEFNLLTLCRIGKKHFVFHVDILNIVVF